MWSCLSAVRRQRTFLCHCRFAILNVQCYAMVLDLLLLLLCLCSFHHCGLTLFLFASKWLCALCCGSLCAYICPLFHLIQGSAFHFQCMYAPPHPVKKCVVLYVRGLLCHVDPSVPSNSSDAPFQNIVQYPGVTKLFMMLLEKFHIRLWSSMTELKLIPLLWHILPAVVMKRLSFILSRKDCHDYKKYPSCHKMYDTLLRKIASRALCLENQILFVNVRPVSMRYNLISICYLPYPFVGELHYLNKSTVIPNVASDIIPFIYPLHRFAFVDEYMMHAIRPSQRHYVAQEHLQRSCCRNT